MRTGFETNRGYGKLLVFSIEIAGIDPPGLS